jgi:hypothetical protein
MIRFTAALAVALAAAVFPAAAAIETVPIETRSGTAQRWWPKVTPPKGWHHDRPHSLNYNLNAMAPEGDSFASAEAIMYARAVKRVSDASIATVEDFIARERKSFLARTPDYTIKEDKPLITKEGLRLRTFNFTPKTDGNWERVAYGEEDDHYILFVVSARSRKAFDGALKPWQGMVWQYRRAP